MTYENYKKMYEILRKVEKEFENRNRFKSALAGLLARRMNSTEYNIHVSAYVPVDKGWCPGIHLGLHVDYFVEDVADAVDYLSDAKYGSRDCYWRITFEYKNGDERVFHLSGIYD